MSEHETNSSSDPHSSSCRSSSDSPLSLDYSADCSSSRNGESDGSLATLHKIAAERGIRNDYARLWHICEDGHRPEQLGRIIRNRTTLTSSADVHSSPSSMHESEMSSTDTNLDAGPQPQQQLGEHPMIPKIVSDNTGSGGSNRDSSHKNETNSTESNSGGDDGLRYARDATDDIVATDRQSFAVQETLLDIHDNQHGLGSRIRLAAKKRRRLDQRKEFEEGGKHAQYSSSTEASTNSDSATVKYFKPVGRPITLDEALSFTHMARIVVLGVSPFLVVHANAAFYRLIGSNASNTIIINRPLSSFIHMTYDHPSLVKKTPTNMEGLNQGDETSLQTLLTSCGYGDVLPIHISLSHACKCQKKDSFTNQYLDGKSNESSRQTNEATKRSHEDMVSCYMSIRPVIREQAARTGRRACAENKKPYHSLSSCYRNSNLSLAFPTIHPTEQTISHFVIHMRIKDDTLSHKNIYPEYLSEDVQIKMDSDSCSSSGTKHIMACA